MLNELVWALQVTLSQVRQEDLVDIQEARLWVEATNWVRIAERAVVDAEASQELAPVPRFPLSGPELRSLQQAVDRAVGQHESHRARNQSTGDVEQVFQRLMRTPFLTDRRWIQATWRDAHWSSLMIAAALVVTLAVSVLDLTIWKHFSLQLVVVANSLLTVIALGLWWLHHLSLKEHHRALMVLRLVPSDQQRR